MTEKRIAKLLGGYEVTIYPTAFGEFARTSTVNGSMIRLLGERECTHYATAEQARNALRAAPGILVVDKREDGGYVTPIECAGEDATFVSRIRKDPTVENGLNLWIVSDNLRKGAALNAVQIAESLINRNLLKVT